ncbi:MAG: hypothetical protein PHV63_03625 [Candidatus Daviesbacteria bacterium]|nr:hypothetical protein [Candidatus Daviesbacteria bacterium]
MQKGSAPIIILVGILILASIGGTYYFYKIKTPEQKACTMDAKICPDGTSVGRTGPNCEFAPCPSPKVTPTPDVSPAQNGADETANWKTYTDNESKFSFRYPQDWKMVLNCLGYEGSIVRKDICFQSTDLDPVDKDYTTSGVGPNKGVVLTVSTYSDSSSKIADINCERLNAENPDSCFYRNLVGKTSLHLINKEESSVGLVITGELIYVPIDTNTVLVIGFFNNKKEVGKDRNIFNQVLETFQIL